MNPSLAEAKKRQESQKDQKFAAAESSWEDLNKRAPRVMAVLDPLRVIITNYPEGQVEELEAVNNPEDPKAGKRKIPFSSDGIITSFTN